MKRDAIKDPTYRTIGYVETMSDGRQRALDAHYRPLGYFDPKQGLTKDTAYRPLARGNVLASLVFKRR